MSASFLSAMNTRAEDAVEETSATENECPVCYDPCAKLSVTCCNGHTICEKHYLQRYKAIYEDGRLAFGDDGVAQCCFMCRSDIEDSFFSKTYFDVLEIVITQGMLKMLNIDKKEFHPTLVRLKKDMIITKELKERYGKSRV